MIKIAKKKRRGRTSKIDKETMKVANTLFLIVIIVFFILLSFTALAIYNPEMYDLLKASIYNLFN